MVAGKCIRFGDPNMTIKKHILVEKNHFAPDIDAVKNEIDNT